MSALLTIWHLHNNALSGAIPAELGQLKFLSSSIYTSTTTT